MADELLTIGEVGERTGVATSALRFYDELGLVRPARRVGGQRRYGTDAVLTVGVIRFLGEVGFSLSEIKRFFASRARSPRAWRELAATKLDQLDAHIAQVQAARTAIDHSLKCPKDDILECPMFRKSVAGVLRGLPVADAHDH